MVKTRNLILMLTCGLLALSALACGDTTEGDDPGNNDPGPLSCEDFAGCGGDLVGTFNFVDVCGSFEENPFEEFCPAAEVDVDFQFSGTIQINANNTYAIEVTNAAVLNFRVPVDCLGGTCAQLEEDATCTLEGDICVCNSTQEDQTEEAGTYTVEGNFVTFLPDDEEGGEGDRIEFCVSGDSALLKPVPDGDDPVIVLEVERQ